MGINTLYYVFQFKGYPVLVGECSFYVGTILDMLFKGGFEQPFYRHYRISIPEFQKIVDTVSYDGLFEEWEWMKDELLERKFDLSLIELCIHHD